MQILNHKIVKCNLSFIIVIIVIGLLLDVFHIGHNRTIFFTSSFGQAIEIQVF